jgi:hypothetical protein
MFDSLQSVCLCYTCTEYDTQYLFMFCKYCIRYETTGQSQNHVLTPSNFWPEWPISMKFLCVNLGMKATLAPSLVSNRQSPHGSINFSLIQKKAHQNPKSRHNLNPALFSSCIRFKIAIHSGSILYRSSQYKHNAFKIALLKTDLHIIFINTPIANMDYGEIQQ